MATFCTLSSNWKGKAQGLRGESRRLSPLGKFRPELLQLRRYDELAVRLPRIVLEVLLMVVLGDVESRRGHELGHDGTVKGALLGEFANERLSGHLLRVGMVENRRTILSAHIVALPIQGRRIVNGEEDLKQVAIRNHGR